MKTQERVYQEAQARLIKKIRQLEEERDRIDEEIAKTEEMLDLLPDIYESN